MVTSSQAQGQYNSAVQNMQKAQANTQPPAYNPATVDSNLYAKPGEDYAAYEARVSAYQTQKAAQQNGQDTSGGQTKTDTGAQKTNDTSGGGAAKTSSPTDTSSGSIATPGLDPALSKAYNDSIDAMTKQLNSAQSTLDAAKATAANDPALQAALDSISNKYNALIADMQNKNKIMLGNANTSMAAFGGLGPMSQSFLSDQSQRASDRVAQLQMEEDNLKLQTKVAYDQKNAKAVTDAQAEYDRVNLEKTNAIKDLLKAVSDQQKQTQDAERADAKLKYDTFTKPIQDLATEARKAGATDDVIKKISGATSVEQAIQLAGDSIQTSTNPDIAQYLFYKQQATQSGTTPISFTAWKDKQDEHAISLKSKEAYATAFASAQGKAAADAINNPTDPAPSGPVGMGGTANGGSILAATGLSIGAFNFLTQGTPSMSRMPAAQRNAIMKEAENYLNRTGTDISTFQSQYKAYNDVLQKNIARANQTSIMAGEVTGSAEALIEAIQANHPANDPIPSVHPGESMGSVRAANILALMAGKSVNNKFAQTYSTQIQFMANDLAGYMAAARGASAPELQDQRDAAEVIANGMNKGSIEAFRDAVKANEAKVNGVVNKAVDTSRKNVWGLFGASDKYSPGKNSSADQIAAQGQQAKQKVDTYITTHPDHAEAVAKLYQTPSAAFGGRTPTDEEIVEYLHLDQ